MWSCKYFVTSCLNCPSDAFYIGGTKMGALFGECLVIINDQLKTDFRYNIKQCGAMLAKGSNLSLIFQLAA